MSAAEAHPARRAATSPMRRGSGDPGSVSMHPVANLFADVDRGLPARLSHRGVGRFVSLARYENGLLPIGMVPRSTDNPHPRKPNDPALDPAQPRCTDTAGIAFDSRRLH